MAVYIDKWYILEVNVDSLLVTSVLTENGAVKIFATEQLAIDYAKVKLGFNGYKVVQECSVTSTAIPTPPPTP
jgi:hypothetical protein